MEEWEERFVAVAAAARLLGVSRQTLLRRCYDGTISYRQIGRRGRIFVSVRQLRFLGVPPEAIRRALENLTKLETTKGNEQ